MTILITDPYHHSSTQLLIDKNHQILTNIPDKESPLANECQAIMIRSRTKINNSLLTQLPNLKYITTSTSGLDHIDLALCQSRQINIFNPKTVNSISAAEQAFALMLAVSKNLVSSQKSLRQNSWKKNIPFGIDLNKKTLGIIGLGQVGSRLAKMALGFNMKLSGYDPYKDQSYFKKQNVEKINSLDQLVGNSDVISLHTPLTDETKQIINSDLLSKFKKNSIFINTSRGRCVEESSLINYLTSRHLAGAGLDVFETEPIRSDHPLLKLDQVILTPHVGAYTEDAFFNASLECSQWLLSQLHS